MSIKELFSYKVECEACGCSHILIGVEKFSLPYGWTEKEKSFKTGKDEFRTTTYYMCHYCPECSVKEKP